MNLPRCGQQSRPTGYHDLLDISHLRPKQCPVRPTRRERNSAQLKSNSKRSHSNPSTILLRSLHNHASTTSAPGVLQLHHRCLSSISQDFLLQMTTLPRPQISLLSRSTYRVKLSRSCFRSLSSTIPEMAPEYATRRHSWHHSSRNLRLLR